MGLLREIFGPSQKEIWENLAREIQGNFEEGGFWRGDKVVAKVKEWTVTLDTHTVSNGKSSTTYTRMRAPFINKDGLRFTIYRQGIFSDIGKLLGMQDIEVGEPIFDAEFIIKGNNIQKVKDLFANPRIRELIELQPIIHFGVKEDDGWFGSEYPEGVNELCFEIARVITDIERLKNLYSLFAEVLNQLTVIDSAYHDNPKIDLK